MDRLWKGLRPQLPNLLTILNLLLGTSAIFMTLGGADHVGLGPFVCLMILAGALADAFDGKLARHLGCSSEMGKQLDSFADLMTFGLAPVALLLSQSMMQESILLRMACLLYLLAGVLRLARYNIGDYGEYFEGLPITAAGSIMALYLLVLIKLPKAFQEPSLFSGFLLLALAGFMISTVRLPRISGLGNPVARVSNREVE